MEDGPAISVTTAQMIACTATFSWMLHDHDGILLDADLRRRRPSAAQGRAARDRDHCRSRMRVLLGYLHCNICFANAETRTSPPA